MREKANASIDFTGVPHLLARPSKGEPNGVVVWSEIQPLVDSLATKLDLAHLKLEQYKNNASIIKRFTLTGGVAAVSASPEDGEDYTYTTFTIQTGFVDNEGNPTIDFEDFAMSAALQPFAHEGFRYEFHKEAPDHAVIVFQNIAGAFPDDRVKISLIRIPEDPYLIHNNDPALIANIPNIRGWSQWDTRYSVNTWDRYFDRYVMVNNDPTIIFRNGAALPSSQLNELITSNDRASFDVVAGLTTT